MGVAELKRRLDEERARLAHEVSALAEEEAGSVGQESGYATHAADDASITFDQARTVALASHARALLRQVEHALVKIEAGSYGRCDRCGGEIAEERLAALPQAALCLTCQAKQQGWR